MFLPNHYFRAGGVLLGLALAQAPAQAGLTDLATSPLVTPNTSSVKPNMIFVLDDSGSMDWDYLPDWVNDRYCKNATGTGSGGANSSCWSYSRGLPVMTTGDINGVYYNPTFTYSPPIDWNGTRRPSITSFTAVRKDGYGVQDTGTINLTTSYPDAEYCTSTSYTTCARNNNYLLPGTIGGSNYQYLHATTADSSGAAKNFSTGTPASPTTTSATPGPYYHVVVAGEYCDTKKLTNCTISNVPTGNYIYPAKLRWCKDAALAQCQAVKTSTYQYPRYPTIKLSGSAGGTSATATIAVGSVTNNIIVTVSSLAYTPSGGGTSVQLLSSPPASTTCTSSCTSQTIASAIAAFIGNGFTASASSGTITVTAPLGSAYNSGTIAVSTSTTTPTGTTPAIPVTNFDNSGSGSSGARGYMNPSIVRYESFTLASLTVTGYGSSLLNAAVNCGSGTSGCDTSGRRSGTRNSAVCEAIKASINAKAGTTGFSASCPSSSPYTLTITSPNGTTYNGATLTPSYGGTATQVTFTPSNFNTAGSNPAAGATSVPGAWKRINIIPSPGTLYGSTSGTYGNLYVDSSGNVTTAASGNTKILDRSGRADCAAPPNCTYAEEMTNFAHWYAYYRTRMQMMKTALTSAFNTVDSKYRVGYFTINQNNATADNVTESDTTAATTDSPFAPASSSGTYRYSSSDFVDIADFTTTQREIFYNTVLSADPSNATPLRAALSKAGQIFAHKATVNGTARDPMQYSCQQNFLILSTDGYWNGTGGAKLDGSAMTDQDGSLARPQFDGNAGSTPTGGSLADASAYYYNTDLRSSSLSNCTGILGTGTDVCSDNVPTTGSDSNAKQHMTTFTLGLGIDGVMQYREDYAAAASSTDQPDDYEYVKGGTSADPATGKCQWQASGACNWPIPGDSRQENIDDLWHAAVNGHGSYYSARNPADLARGLNSALAGVSARTGAAAAATTSNPNVTSGDNFVFSSNFTTFDWTGDLYRQTIDINTGAISAGKDWSARDLLDGVVAADRSVWMLTADTTTYSTKLKPFKWADLTSNALYACGDANNERACVSQPYINGLSQFCASGTTCLTSSQQTTASGQNLVNYLRGDKTYDDSAAADVDKLYRQRAHLLGDIVSAEAVYVKKSLMPYDEATNTGYAAFQAANETRQGVVYAASNDGMLHAFNADSGAELWAFVPSMTLPSLYKLADKTYSTNHIYLVDGTPVVGDANVGGGWKTILVGGLAGGGAGYYALDVSNPGSPRGLWEFKKKTSSCAATIAAAIGQTSDCDLGYGYGNPIIAKVNGTWSVLVTSGYNNVSPGDGKGYLYILNAATGAIINKIATTAGGTATPACTSTTDSPCPSGLGKLNAWADNASHDNTVTVAYAGDMFGNLWRFDLVTGAASRLATLLGPGDVAQPITAKPELGQVGTKPVVFIQTGRLLGNNDLADPNQTGANKQGFYAIWDKGDGSTWLDPASNSAFVAAPVTCTSGGGCTATTATSVFDDASKGGWYLTYASNERGYTDPTLAFGTIVFTTNFPESSACTAGGTSRIYYLDFKSGGFVQSSGSTSGTVATFLGNALATRPVLVKLPNNKIVSLTKLSNTDVVVTDVPINLGSSSLRRVSWRELTH